MLVLASLIAARDFKYLRRMIRNSFLEPYVLHARGQGISDWRILIGYVFPQIAPDLAALSLLSITAAVSALVPVEVLFSLPGVGQLAWNAAVNRDLPVLLCSTLVIAVVYMGAELAGSFHILGSPNEA